MDSEQQTVQWILFILHISHLYGQTVLLGKQRESSQIDIRTENVSHMRNTKPLLNIRWDLTEAAEFR